MAPPTTALPAAAPVLQVAACRVCGCTEDDACPGRCFWVDPQVRDLCSACAPAGLLAELGMSTCSVCHSSVGPGDDTQTSVDGRVDHHGCVAALDDAARQRAGDA